MGRMHVFYFRAQTPKRVPGCRGLPGVQLVRPAGGRRPVSGAFATRVGHNDGIRIALDRLYTCADFLMGV